MIKLKKITAAFLAIIMIASFIPFNSLKTLAADAYTVTFRVTEGTHTLEQSGTTDLGINGSFLSLEDPDRNKLGTLTKIDDNEYQLAVSSGEAGNLMFNNDDQSYSLFIGENQINPGYGINGNTLIEIKNYVEQQDQPGPGPGPGPDNPVEQITYRLDNATVSGNVITFTVENETVTATVTGTGYSFNGNELIVECAHFNDVKVTLDNNFDSSRMYVDVNGESLTVNGDREMVLGSLTYTDNAPHLSIMMNGSGGQPGQGGGDTQSYPGNTTSTLDFSITGAIEYTDGAGYDYGIGFRINDIQYRANRQLVSFTEEPAYERDGHGQYILNENNEKIPVLDPDTMQQMNEKTGLSIEGDTIKHDSEGDTVDFVFTMAPGTLMTGLTINGTPVDNLPDDKAELEACYRDHALEIPVRGIAKAAKYEIEIEARYPNSDEEFLGNFLWDYNPQGYTGPDDKILNGTLTFVKAEYDGHTYTTPEEINSLGGVFIWRDAERKKKYSEDPEKKDGVGEAQFPVGTKLTVKIIPDAGYQLIDFGINGGAFDPQEEIGTYTFEVQGGPFHLQATIAQVEDVVKTESEKIAGGLIEFGGQEESMAIGTARLDVTDIELNKEQISNFEEAAEGYEISSYLDISLFNTVFKGTEKESWDTQVKDLDNEAEITLKLEDGIDGEGLVIVHEKHDGTYEIIPTTYDAETNTITFKTKSFSNYALASKTEAVETASVPKTGDNIVIFAAILAAAVIGYVVITVIKKNKRK